MQFSNVRHCILQIDWIWFLKRSKIYWGQESNVKYVHPTGCYLYSDLHTHTTLTGSELIYGYPLIIFVRACWVCRSVWKYLLACESCAPLVHANNKSWEEKISRYAGEVDYQENYNSYHKFSQSAVIHPHCMVFCKSIMLLLENGGNGDCALSQHICVCCIV